MFDTRRFLADHFSDPDALVALVTDQCGVDLQRETVRKWFTRESVPGEWAFVVVCAIERATGTAPSLSRYMDAAPGETGIFD